MRSSVVVVTLLAAASLARADAPAQPTPMLDGRVTSATSSLPVAGVSVFIATSEGLQQTVVTDDTGHYHAELHALGGYNLIFAFGTSRVSRHFDLEPHTDVVLDEVLDDTGEVITIHAPRVPPVPPKAIKDTTILPPYSAEAANGNYWSKAWLLLDVDATGAVTRVKFLKRPGHDLDPIAVEAALATQFSPARDEHGDPARMLVVWPIEWPSYWWLVSRTGFSTRRPANLAVIPCRGHAPLNLDRVVPVLRDCSEPDLSAAASEPWITARP